MQNVLLQYGILGVVVLGMASYIMYLHKEHNKQRKEWLQTLDRLLDKADSRERETTQVVKENTGILAGLKTLFEIHIKGR